MIKARDWMADDGEEEQTNETPQNQTSSDDSSSSSSSSEEEEEGEDHYENDYNFAKASKESAVVPLVNQPESKNFYLLNPKNHELMLFSINSDEAGQIYQMAGDLVKFKVGKFVLRYPIRRANGKRRYVTIHHNDKIESNCNQLYCQTESEATLEVEKITTGRKKKKCESIFSTFQKFRLMNRASYELFNEDIYVLEEFLESVRFTRIWLGHKCCVNMLNPGKMVCPIVTCRDVRCLKHFNDFGYMYDHLIKHKVDDDADATILVDRYAFVKGWIGRNRYMDLDEAISTVESTSNKDGKSLSISKLNLFRPSPKDKFTGRQCLMDETAVEKYIFGDKNALQRVNAPIASYFATSSKGVSSSVTSAVSSSNEVMITKCKESISETASSLAKKEKNKSSTSSIVNVEKDKSNGKSAMKKSKKKEESKNVEGLSKKKVEKKKEMMSGIDAPIASYFATSSKGVSSSVTSAVSSSNEVMITKCKESISETASSLAKKEKNKSSTSSIVNVEKDKSNGKSAMKKSKKKEESKNVEGLSKKKVEKKKEMMSGIDDASTSTKDMLNKKKPISSMDD